MARVQILPLPPITLGDSTKTPFVLVFDGDTSEWSDEFLDSIKDQTGAALVIMAEELDVGAPLTLSIEQQHEILTQLGVQQYDLAPHD